MNTQEKLQQREELIVATLKEQINAGATEAARDLLIKFGATIGYSPETERWLDKYLTNDPQLIETKRRAMILAHCKHTMPVMIYGETGTGKELLARAIHGNRLGKFIAINCASLPDTLIEAELFGYKKGAFTDAQIDRDGKLAAAENGTLFLDEIGDMPLPMQAKLLRVIQEKKYSRLGCNEERSTNARIVGATHRNLIAMVEQGKFREDLYYRISPVELHTKPLRERGTDDIRLILDELDFMGNDNDIGEISKKPLKGNVRELQKIVINHKLFGAI